MLTHILWRLNSILQYNFLKTSFYRKEMFLGKYKIVPCGIIPDLIIESLHY
jgi:hypothetical protein